MDRSTFTSPAEMAKFTNFNLEKVASGVIREIWVYN